MGHAGSYVQDQLPSASEIEFLEYAVDEATKRHEEIRNIEQEVREVASIFVDLKHLVDEQQVSTHSTHSLTPHCACAARQQRRASSRPRACGRPQLTACILSPVCVCAFPLSFCCCSQGVHRCDRCEYFLHALAHRGRDERAGSGGETSKECEKKNVLHAHCTTHYYRHHRRRHIVLQGEILRQFSFVAARLSFSLFHSSIALFFLWLLLRFCSSSSLSLFAHCSTNQPLTIRILQPLFQKPPNTRDSDTARL